MSSGWQFRYQKEQILNYLTVTFFINRSDQQLIINCKLRSKSAFLTKSCLFWKKSDWLKLTFSEESDQKVPVYWSNLKIPTNSVNDIGIKTEEVTAGGEGHLQE